MATMCRKCHFEGHDDSSSFPSFFTSWELSASYEVKRQIQLSYHEIDHDEGVLFWIEKASQEAGWPPFEAMHLLKEAAELGIMTSEWLADLSKQVVATRKQKASNQ